jgi:D-psicose/D-tagatose/L-ribulose 3-epimerase
LKRLSVSNLAWPDTPVESIAPRLRAAGIQGVEIAPTAIWPEAPHVPAKVVREHAERWRDHGLKVSGIQSLLYGHPELQLFDRATWPAMQAHLTSMIEIARGLGARIAVFGSPRNRIRGSVEKVDADQLASEFFHSLAPVLAASGVVLTLEPNAPGYGADYLTRYGDVVALSNSIGSPWIQPQVDTGCLTMVGEDPAHAIRMRAPAHVHISVPDLLPPPGPVDHAAVVRALNETGYDGWIVLEVLRATSEPLDTAMAAARWLVTTYASSGHDDAAH